MKSPAFLLSGEEAVCDSCLAFNGSSSACVCHSLSNGWSHGRWSPPWCWRRKEEKKGARSETKCKFCSPWDLSQFPSFPRPSPFLLPLPSGRQLFFLLMPSSDKGHRHRLYVARSIICDSSSKLVKGAQEVWKQANVALHGVHVVDNMRCFVHSTTLRNKVIHKNECTEQPE